MTVEPLRRHKLIPRRIDGEYPAKSLWDLEIIAQKLYLGKIFSTQSLPKDDPQALGKIFVPLSRVSQRRLQTIVNKAGMIYQETDKAFGSVIAGYPSFRSMEILNEHDTKIVLAKFYEIKDYFEARQTTARETTKPRSIQ